jgi:hypothetical protein
MKPTLYVEYTAVTTYYKTINSNARVKIVQSKTITSNAKVVFRKYETIEGTARIKTTKAETIISNARIKKKFMETITGAGRIKITQSATINGTARIGAAISKTISGNALIYFKRYGTIKGNAAITRFMIGDDVIRESMGKALSDYLDKHVFEMDPETGRYFKGERVSSWGWGPYDREGDIVIVKGNMTYYEVPRVDYWLAKIDLTTYQVVWWGET